VPEIEFGPGYRPTARAIPPAFFALAFENELEYHYLYVRINSSDDQVTSDINLVEFLPAPPEFTQYNRRRSAVELVGLYLCSLNGMVYMVIFHRHHHHHHFFRSVAVGGDTVLSRARFSVPPNTLQVISGTGCFGYGSKDPTNSVKALKEEKSRGPGFNPTRSTPLC